MVVYLHAYAFSNHDHDDEVWKTCTSRNLECSQSSVFLLTVDLNPELTIILRVSDSTRHWERLARIISKTHHSKNDYSRGLQKRCRRSVN
jgi:hypothetical protein